MGETEDAPSASWCAVPRSSEVLEHLRQQFFQCVPLSDRHQAKERRMLLKIRYENEFQYLELNDDDTKGLWVSLSLEGDEVSEEKLQEAFDEQFNRPEYNIEHRETRHISYSGGKDEYGTAAISEPNPKRVKDKSIFSREEDTRLDWIEYEEVCKNIRSILAGKPAWAEAVIAIRIDGWSVNDYADRIGVKDASAVSHWLRRAEKKLRDSYPGASDFLRCYGNKVKRGHSND